MKKSSNTNQDLIAEISVLKQRLQELEQSESEHKRVEEEMAVITEIGRVIGSTLNIEEVYERFAAEAHKLIHFDRIHVNLKDPDEETFTIAYVSGLDVVGRRVGDKIPFAGSITEAVFRTSSGMLFHPVSDEEILSRFPNASAATTFRAGMRSIMAIPLISRDEVIGALQFRAKKPNAYTEQDLRMAEKIGMQIAGAIANAQLFRKMQKAETLLRASESRYRMLFDNSPDGILIAGIESKRFIYANPSICRMFGYAAEEMGRLGVADIHPPEQLSQAMTEFEALGKGEKLVAPNIPCLRKDGTIFYTDITAAAAVIDGIACSVGFFRDITERKQIEEGLQESEAKYRILFNNDRSSIYIFDLETLRFLDANDSSLRLYGYSREEMLGGMRALDITAEPEKSAGSYKIASEGGTIFIPLRWHRKKDGTVFPVEIVGGPYVWKGRRVMFGMIQDITERKQAEDKIQASLLEKVTLLKEIHHRVKNNLQVISSLLGLQSSYLQDEKAREALKESMARVRTMAMIHTHIYQSNDLTRVDFGLFIRDLIGHIRQAYGRTDSPLEIDVDTDDMRLGIETSIPCGLILNELIANALKHGLREGKEGKINIRMRSEDNRVVLTVCDNGIGFPESIDLANLKSLGLKLVNILVEQMNGQIGMQVDGGTRWTITFPVKNEREQ